MKYLTTAEDACEGEYGGEIEDYCINIYEATDQQCANSNISDIFPIPSGMQVQWSPSSGSTVYHFRYRLANSNQDWTLLTSNQPFIELYDLSSCEEYECQVRNICALGISPFSDSWLFIANCVVASAHSTQEASLIEIFPNPFHHHITLHFTQPQTVQTTLYSLTGALLQSQVFSASPQIDWAIDPQLPAGLYLLRIQGKTIELSQRVVKLNSD
ncbi:MAG: T9SS type A sorting domain-containing protein, partial [Bacteroidota bacterium]